MPHMWGVWMNTAPYPEHLQVSQSSANPIPENPVAQRLADHVLRGRSLREWARQVLLSNGTVHRLWQGSIPDLERLTPAIRIERLSLSWLHDGLGAPFVVNVMASPSVEELRDIMDPGQGETFSLLCRNDLDHTLVVYQPRKAIHSSKTRDGTREREYNYLDTVVIVGPDLGPTIQLAGCSVAAADGHVSVIDMNRQLWSRLSTGYMGNPEFFEILKSKVRRGSTFPLPPSESLRVSYAGVHESDDDAQDVVTEATELLQELSSVDQSVALRILKGLRHYNR